MSPRGRFPTLDKAEQILRALNGRWKVSPNVSEQNATKLRALARTGRDFLAPGRDIETAVLRFVRAELSFEPSANERKLLTAAARGVQAAVVLRFTAQQSVTLRPLTLEYLRRKIARGLDRRIGIATKSLVQELAAGTWRIERAV
jgi:hypothetical protein